MNDVAATHQFRKAGNSGVAVARLKRGDSGSGDVFGGGAVDRHGPAIIGPR